MKLLVTGCAGFIGAACTQHLLQRGDEVIGIDNLNDYYDVSLKKARLHQFQDHPQFNFYQQDIKNAQSLNEIFTKHKPQGILHLAAQAGVRYSLENPMAYVDSNLVGFANILETARHHNIEHLVYASSSSVYGNNSNMPYSIHDNVDHPLSLYAATKKSNELMAHSYSHLYNIPVTGLRFFTVYGPWGRPDMAPIKFAKKIIAGEPIQIYNFGEHSRDFTYIDDIVNGTIKVLDKPATANQNWDIKNPDPASSQAPYKLYNIGRGQPMQLMDFIGILEKNLGIEAIKEFLPKQPGDVDHTWADTKDLSTDLDYKPKVDLEEGIARFAEWFKGYYQK